MRTILLNLQNYAIWLAAVVSFFVRKDHTAVALTPPPLLIGQHAFLFNNQRVLNRQTGRTVALAIETPVEYFVFRNVFERGAYDLPRLARWPSIKAAYDRIVASGRTPLILDCGANAGFSAVYFALLFPAARIVAIEPQAQNFKRACVTTKGFDHIRVVQAGIACDEGTARIIDPGRGADAYRTELSDSGDVRMVSIGSLLRDEGSATVPFAIKIDIEGFESNVFECDTEWIEQFFLLTIELHDWMLPDRAISRNFLKAISQYDRDFVYFDENIFSIKNTAATSQ